MINEIEIIKDKLEKLNLNIVITETILNQFLDYYNTLVEWNTFMNLTAITDLDQVVEKHFVDSIVLGQYLDLNKMETMIDIGTGAGFPGLPLKIMYPHLHLVLVDSLNKRIEFLKEMIAKLQLENVKAVHGRAEELARDENYRAQFDLSVSRAVARLSSLTEYCMPFVKVGGIFAAYKSSEIEQEVEESKKAIQLLGGELAEIKIFPLSDTEYKRSLVMINKRKQTPKKFPRKSGIPTKQPIT